MAPSLLPSSATHSLVCNAQECTSCVKRGEACQLNENPKRAPCQSCIERQTGNQRIPCSHMENFCRWRVRFRAGRISEDMYNKLEAECQRRGLLDKGAPPDIGVRTVKQVFIYYYRGAERLQVTMNRILAASRRHSHLLRLNNNIYQRERGRHQSHARTVATHPLVTISFFTTLILEWSVLPHPLLVPS